MHTPYRRPRRRSRASIMFWVGLLAFVSTVAPSPSLAQRMSAGVALDSADVLRRLRDYTGAWEVLSGIAGDSASMTPYERGRWWKMAGDVATGRRDYGGARERYRRARKLFAAAEGDDAIAARLNTYTSVAVLSYFEGDTQRAIDSLMRVVDLARAAGDPGLAPARIANVNLSVFLEAVGDYDGALEAARRAIVLLRASGQTSGQSLGVAYNALGTSLLRLGRYSEAGVSYDTAAQLLRAIYPETHAYVQSALGNLAAVYAQLDEPDRAVPVYLRKLAALETDLEANRTAVVNTYLNLGTAYRQLGDPARSRAALRRALARHREADPEPSRLEASILRELGRASLRDGDVRRAGESLARAVEIHRDRADTLVIEFAEALMTRAQVRAAREDTVGAVGDLRRAYALSRRFEGGLGATLETLAPGVAHTLTTLGRPREASRILDTLAAELAARRGSLPARRSDGLAALQQVYRLEAALVAGGDAPLAEAAERSLVAAVESSASLLDDIRGRRVRRHHAHYGSALRIGLAVLAASSLREARAARADPEAEQAALKRALRYLDAGQRYLWPTVPPSAGPDGDSGQRDREILLQRLAGYETLAYAPDAEPARVARYLDSARTLELRLTQAMPRGEGLLDAPGFDAARLAGDVTGIVAFSGYGEVYVVHVGAGRPARLVAVLSSAAFERDRETFLEYVRDPARGARESASALAAAHRLYKSLIGDASGRLAVVESPATAGIPVEALLTRSPAADRLVGRELPFAIHDHSFSYFSSLAALHRGASSTRRPRRRSEHADWIGIAPGDIGTVDAGNPLALAEAPLPAAVEEVVRLAERLAGHVLLGSEATVGAFSDAIARASILHVASHARSNVEDSEFSYLLLAAGDSTGYERVYARQLRDLAVASDLVFLSSCETGRGVPQAGEGSLSLSSALLRAGAGAVVHTGWRIEDRRARELVPRVYALLGDGGNLDEVLAEAQRAFLAESPGQYTHPFYWSAYRVSGDVEVLQAGTSWWLLGGAAAAGLLGLAFVSRRRRRLRVAR